MDFEPNARHLTQALTAAEFNVTIQVAKAEETSQAPGAAKATVAVRLNPSDLTAESLKHLLQVLDKEREETEFRSTFKIENGELRVELT